MTSDAHAGPGSCLAQGRARLTGANPMKLLLRLAVFSASAAAALCCFAAPAVDWVSALKPAQQAEAAGQIDRAQALYSGLARKNPLAQFALGRLMLNSPGRARDPSGACAWFKKAAQRRIPAAEHEWGECLANGVNTPADVVSALTWWERAASGGHLISRCRAADFLISGQGVPRDSERGLEMCASVAQAGSTSAMLQMARHYRGETGLAPNPVMALHWLQYAAEQGSVDAQYSLGVMLAQGDGVEPDLGQALRWMESAAQQGHVRAYLPTAVLYANQPVQPSTGILAPEHLAKIYFWNSAAAARSANAQERAEIQRIAGLVEQVMPPDWRPSLDRELAEHLARFPEAALTAQPQAQR